MISDKLIKQYLKELPLSIQFEITENMERKDFSNDEKVKIGKLIENIIGERRGGDTSKKSKRDNFSHLRNIRTTEIAAELAGFENRKDYEHARLISAKANNETKTKLDSGEFSINQAYTEIKNGDKKEKLAKQIIENKKSLNNIITKKPKIFNKDCINFLESIKDKSIDLLITDPPYITDLNINIDEFLNQWLFLALNKVKDTGRVYICTGAYPQEQKAYLNKLLSQNRFIVDNPLIWTYRNTLGKTPSMKYNLNYQIIHHLYLKDSYFLDTSVTNEMFSVQDINAPDGRVGNRFYKFQKPEELARRLITHSTKENNNILDCFAGSGIFLIIGAKLKRNCIGCDNSQEALQIAENLGCEIIE